MNFDNRIGECCRDSAWCLSLQDGDRSLITPFGRQNSSGPQAVIVNVLVGLLPDYFVKVHYRVRGLQRLRNQIT